MKFRNLYPFLSLAIVAIAVTGFWKRHIETSPPLGSSILGIITQVADGDTLTIETGGKRERIRLCGIDSPEKDQSLGQEAKQTLERMTLGKQVAFVPVDRDRYGRTVAEVFVLGEPEHFINGDLVEAGMAYHYAQYSRKCPNQNAIAQAEDIARAGRAGLWANPRAVKPWDYRKTP